MRASEENNVIRFIGESKEQRLFFHKKLSFFNERAASLYTFLQECVAYRQALIITFLRSCMR